MRLLRDEPGGALELLSETLHVGDFSKTTVSWYSADPIPLDRLVSLAGESLTHCLFSADPVPSRLRVTFRWYANAHGASAKDDAALALGVSLDAIVGAKQGLPGQLMAQRFAFLDSDPAA